MEAIKILDTDRDEKAGLNNISLLWPHLATYSYVCS